MRIGHSEFLGPEIFPLIRQIADQVNSDINRDAFYLRYRFLPYIYSMAWNIHQNGSSLVTPVYHYYPLPEESYHCPKQYFFGTELLVAPFLCPMDPSVHLSRSVVWFPEGKWSVLFLFWSYLQVQLFQWRGI